MELLDTDMRVFRLKHFIHFLHDTLIGDLGLESRVDLEVLSSSEDFRKDGELEALSEADNS